MRPKNQTVSSVQHLSVYKIEEGLQVRMTKNVLLVFFDIWRRVKYDFSPGTEHEPRTLLLFSEVKWNIQDKQREMRAIVPTRRHSKSNKKHATLWRHTDNRWPPALGIKPVLTFSLLSKYEIKVKALPLFIFQRKAIVSLVKGQCNFYTECFYF